MKKKCWKIIFIIILILPIYVKAYYNGGGGKVGYSGGSCPKNTKKLCPYKNMHHLTVLVSLYYFNEDGTRDKIGKSVIYTNNNILNDSNFFEFNVNGKFTGNATIGYDALKLENYFYKDLDNFRTLLNRTANMGLTEANYKEKLNEFFINYCNKKGKNTSNCSQAFNKTTPAKYGFRVVIEPYISGLKHDSFYYMTLKEIAADGGLTNINSTASFSLLLHTIYNDVGITAYTTKTTNLNLIKDPNSGYGYNIIDFAVKPDDISQCDKTKVGVKACCNEKNLKYPITEEEYQTYCNEDTCKYMINTKVPQTCSANNNGYVKDVKSWECIFKSPKSSKKEVKEFYKDYSNDYCSIFCREEINYSLPSGANAVSSGRFLSIEQVSESGSLAILSPINFNGKKICRTTSKDGDNNGTINRTKFEKDFNDIEIRIKNAYDKYLNYKNESKTSVEIANAKEEYKNLVDKRDSLISQIKACSERSVTYDFSPNLYLSYDEPIYGGEWKLKKDATITKTESYYSGGNATNGTSSSVTTDVVNKKILKYSCNESSGCTKLIEDSYPLTDWYEKSIEKNYNYDLPDNVYRYVSKETGRSYHKKEDAGENYVTINKGNLPIHYSTNPGDYEFKIRIESLGTNNKFEKYLYDKKTFDGKLVFDEKMEYACSYKVNCKDQIMNGDCEAINDYCYKDDEDKKNDCNEQGANIIYRPISLYKDTAFLSTNGDKRKPGKNWDDKDLINEIIYNNRTVESYSVYKLDPMYEITLTPTVIKEIRNYNKEMNGKRLTIYNDTGIKQTGIAGYADYESMTCDSNGITCKSSLLKKWKVNGCAIKNENSELYTNCGNSVNW